MAVDTLPSAAGQLWPVLSNCGPFLWAGQMVQELRGALIALAMAFVVFAVAAAIAQPMTIFFH